jgi:phosphatidylglycerol:prolipoprotein diacylglycerol transferase
MIRNSKKLSLLSLGFVNLIIFIYGLHLVFIGQIILPQEFVFANFRVRYYGLALALATASAYAIGLYRAKDYGLVHKTAESIMLLAVIGGFIGARLYHVVVEFSLYQNNLWDAFAVWHQLRVSMEQYGLILVLIFVFFIWQILSPIIGILFSTITGLAL